MTYKAFYSLYENDLHVSSQRPRAVEPDVLFYEVFAQMGHDGDFLGIVDDSGAVLQIAYEKSSDMYWVEIPTPKEKGSFGYWLTFDRTSDVLRGLPSAFVPNAFPNMKFYSHSALPAPPGRV
jgi:hypothetical protein